MKNEETQRVRTYEYINIRIKNAQEEVDRLTNELNDAKEKHLRRKVKETRKYLKIEKGLLKSLNKTKKTYIDVKAEIKKQESNKHDLTQGIIDVRTFSLNKLISELKIKRLRGRNNQNLPTDYLEEIEDEVVSSYKERVEFEEENNIKCEDVRKKSGIIGTIIVLAVAIALAISVKISIDKHPADIYKDLLSKKDDFSKLMDEIEGKIKSSDKEESPSPSINVVDIPEPTNYPVVQPKEPEYDSTYTTENPQNTNIKIIHVK